MRATEVIAKLIRSAGKFSWKRLVVLAIVFVCGCHGGEARTSGRSASAESRAQTIAAQRLQFRLAAADPNDPNAQRIPYAAGGPATSLAVARQVYLDERDVKIARPVTGSDGQARVGIEFTDAGSRKVSQLTAAHIGEPLAVIFDGVVITAPVIRTRIAKSAEISSGRTMSGDDALRLSRMINAAVKGDR